MSVLAGVLPTCLTAQIGSIDAPQDQEVVLGYYGLGGWGMDSQAPLVSVGIFVDGTNFGNASYGGNRSDACNAIGNYPGCPNVGWSLLFNTTNLVDGPHILKVVLTTSDNRQSTLVRAFIVDNARRGLDNDTYYTIVSRASGKVVDVPGANPNNGTQLLQYPSVNNANQLWQLTSTRDGSYIFESLSSSKALSIPYGASANATAVEQDEDYGAEEQRWNLVASGDGYYAFFNAASGKALDLQGGSSADGTVIQIYQYFGNSNQQWSLVPALSPPSGLFGAGGSDGSSNPPQISVDDILFSPEAPNSSFFAPGANGPVCESAAELAGISALSAPPDSSGILNLTYDFTNKSGIEKRNPTSAVNKSFTAAFNSWNDFTTTTFVNFSLASSDVSGNVHVASGNNEQAGYCAQFVPTNFRSVIWYGSTFASVARQGQIILHRRKLHKAWPRTKLGTCWA